MRNLRRPSKVTDDWSAEGYEIYPYDNTPNKLEEILGRPEAPIRNIRKTKRNHVKSLGEEVNIPIFIFLQLQCVSLVNIAKFIL